MDGREPLPIPGSASYFIHNRTGPVPGASPQHRQGILQNAISSSAGPSFHSDSPPFVPHSSISPGAVASAGPGSSEPVKRKRGRPRKYGPDGSMNLGLSPLRSTSSGGSASVSRSGSGSVPSASRRGRGRPPGTGRKQQLASLGGWFSGSAGAGFTPHVITISVGEDIAMKIMTFSQQGPRAVCILSATGAVSRVTLRQAATSSGTVTYEGRFEILSLSGSFSIGDDGEHNQNGILSISLSSPDGRVIGGGVGGLLIAATPVQVIMGSFMYGGVKEKNKAKSDRDSGPEPELPVADNRSTNSLMSNQNLTTSFFGGWPGTREMDMRNAHFDIDLTRG